MTKDQLVRHYPKLYHMSEAGSWASIQKHGLLSTSALLDLFEIKGTQRSKCESQWRHTSINITHPIHGKAVIRDQKPMPPEDLSKCLDGLVPSEWYEFLNGKTFFWVTKDRLLRLLNAAAYRDRSHWVIIVDTRCLVERHFGCITLSDINSGFVYHGGQRGLDTFKTIDEFPSSKTVWELAVGHSVPDIAELAISVEEWKGNNKIRTIWLT